jgi:cytochrome c-type biogenesis protein CcmE
MATTLEAPVSNGGRTKFLIGGGVILLAAVYLIVTSTMAGAQYFFTVDELIGRGEAAFGTPSRISGAVVPDTISYDAQTLELRFTIAHMPAEQALLEEDGGLAEALFAAAHDPNRTHLEVVYFGPMPDLLQPEAQAIVTGELGEDGIFYADELLLKCPTRYDEVAPEQVEG